MGKRVLITGASGSLGVALAAVLRDAVLTDSETMDVRGRNQVRLMFRDEQPELVYHLAAAKHAPEGELDPWQVVETNVIGSRNVLEASAWVGARVVLASTCKAADPETVYGASKLIAERMTLNAGQTVARFYNVPETCGNVFETWRALDETEPVPFTDCWRYFIPMGRAVELLLACADLPPGRYTVDPGESSHMADVARTLYPDRELTRIARRRGDRQVELRHARSEHLEPVADGVERVVCTHDAVRDLAAA